MAKSYVSPREMHPSQLINRRPLSPATDAELRRACHAFAKYNRCDDDSSKNDFELVQRYMTDKHVRPHPSSKPRHHTHDSHSHRTRDDSSRKRHAARPEKPTPDVLVRATAAPVHFPANVGYRRDLPSPLKVHRSEKPHTRRQDSADHDRKRGSGDRHRSHRDSDDSYSTPLTASTDIGYNPASTAMTSLASPNRELVHDSRPQTKVEPENLQVKNGDNGARGYDAPKQKSNPISAAGRQSGEKVRGSSRELSRTRSIRGEIREYFRPGSANKGNISRSSSQESMRDEASGKRRGSTSIWRSWSLRRKHSDASLTQQSEGSQDELSEKTVPDLNRELPPLPGLDQWKGEDLLDEVAVNEPKPHISQLMKASTSEKVVRPASRAEHARVASPKNEVQKPRSATATNHLPPEPATDDAARKMSHRRSSTCPDLKQAQTTSANKENTHPVKIQAAKEFDFDALLSAMERTEIGQEWIQPQSQPQRQPHLHNKERVSPSGDILRPITSTKYSLDQARNAPNFSRKISSDIPQRQNTAPISPAKEKSNPSLKQPKGLHKVFSRLLTRKQSKMQNWSNNSRSQNGVNNAFVLHDEAAGAPVIRY